MGWTYTHRSPGTSHKDWFGQQHNYDNDRAKGEILAAASVGMTVYAAYKVTIKATGVSKVIALIYLTRRVPNDRDYNFGYKDLEESMGVGECECPEKILKLLTPLPPREYDENGVEKDTGVKSSHDWRERCWAHVAASKAIKAGTTFSLSTPIPFGWGYEVTGFRIESCVPWKIHGLTRMGTTVRVRFGRTRLVSLLAAGKAHLEGVSVMTKQQTQEKAAVMYNAMNTSERHGIDFGVFPFKRMEQAKAEGYDGKELAIALMDHASAQTTTATRKEGRSP